MRRAISRHQSLLLALFLLSIPAQALGVPQPFGLAIAVLLFLLSTVRPERVDREPLVVDPPVRGRWRALNSPGTKVPSHGVRLYGQTYAIDVLQPGAPDPEGWGLDDPERFPAFGEPVRAMAAGRVVRVLDGQADHRARRSLLAVLYLLIVEASARQVAGAHRVIGNHVVVDHGEGAFSLSGHLRRGSIAVAVGDLVDAGTVLGAVGNSGNSSEPHLHVQLMDRARAEQAAGLPFRWRGWEPVPGDAEAAPAQDGAVDGVPRTGEEFVVAAATAGTDPRP
jgi:hypothetical protein